MILNKTLNSNKKKELNWVNLYHKKVYENLSKYHTLQERNWLQNVTKPL